LPITLRGGWGSARIAQMNDFSGGRNGDGAKFLAPDFYTLYCSINDIADGTATATYQAAVNNIAAQISPISNGCLVLGYPLAGSANWGTLSAPYANALKTVATNNGWGFYDSRNVFGPDNATASARGYRFDDRHPSAAGHAAFAAGYLAQLRAWGMSI
jgi:lysophospholipase L1-like esterase